MKLQVKFTFSFSKSFWSVLYHSNKDNLGQTVGVHANVCAFSCRGQRSSSGFLPLVSSTLIFEVDFLIGLNLDKYTTWQAKQAQVSTFPRICLQSVLFKYRTLVVIIIRYFWDLINTFQWSRVGSCACHTLGNT